MPNSYVVKAGLVGQGLFASRRIRVGETITDIPGRRVSADVVWDIGGALSDNAFRYGPETFLDPLDGPGRWVNHSCAPNAAVEKRGHRLFLVAASGIRAGEEIVIDYSTILGGDDIWTMRCACGSGDCRGVVRNLAKIPATVRSGYIDRGMVPGFILRTL